MLKYKGPNPDKHVLGGVLFTLDPQGQVLTAQDAVTLEAATPEQLRKVEAVAPRFAKFWEVLPEAADDPEDDAEDNEPRRPRRRRKEAEG